MKKLIIPLLSTMAFLMMSCSNDVTPSYTYEGFFNETDGGGMNYMYGEKPDTVMLILNASKVSCDSTETVEEVPYGESPLYIGKSYVLNLSENHATLNIEKSASKYDYVADKRVRQWHYRVGEYTINTTGYEDFQSCKDVYKAIVVHDHMKFKSYIGFFRKNGDKDELAFRSDATFTHTEYGPKRAKTVEMPASVEEQYLTVSKEDEYNWILTGEDVAYRFHIQNLELIQTSPSYKYIGKLFLKE